MPKGDRLFSASNWLNVDLAVMVKSDSGWSIAALLSAFAGFGGRFMASQWAIGCSARKRNYFDWGLAAMSDMSPRFRAAIPRSRGQYIYFLP